MTSPPTDSSSELDIADRMKDQSDDDEAERPDLRSIGEGLGFGNTAWGSRNGNGFTRPASENDEDVTTTNAGSDSGNATSETEELVDDAETRSGEDEEIVVDKAGVSST